MENKDKALGISLIKNEKNSGNFTESEIIFWNPENGTTRYSMDQNLFDIFDHDSGFYYMSNLSYIGCFDGEKKIIDADYARALGYIWSNFFEFKGEVCCLRYGLVSSSLDILQLTLRQIPDFDKIDRGLHLMTNDIENVKIGNSNKIYLAHSNGIISSFMLGYNNNRISQISPPEKLGKRMKQTNFVFHREKIYDYTENKLYDTEKDKVIFESESPIISAHSLENLLVSNSNGEIVDAENKKKIFSAGRIVGKISSFNGRLVYSAGQEIKDVDGNVLADLRNETGFDIYNFIPISGRWYK